MNLEVACCRLVPDPGNQSRHARDNRGGSCKRRHNGPARQLANIELNLRPTTKPID